MKPFPTDRIKIELPRVFPTDVIAGVTERNLELFPETGLSLLKAQILSDSDVETHRQFLAECIGTTRKALRFQQQVHGVNIAVIANEATQGHTNEPFEESDGMITQRQGLVLCAGIADCAAVLLYDPENRAVAAIHSGWKGTAGNIVQKGIQTMAEQYGSQASSMLAFVSPCASGERYVVRGDVAQFFTEPALRRLNAEEFLFNNRLRIREQLEELGVKPENIEVSSGCTMSDERYHSHRRDRERAGRMVAFIGVR